jgi:hypothetical protein
MYSRHAKRLSDRKPTSIQQIALGTYGRDKANYFSHGPIGKENDWSERICCANRSQLLAIGYQLL